MKDIWTKQATEFGSLLMCQTPKAYGGADVQLHISLYILGIMR